MSYVSYAPCIYSRKSCRPNVIQTYYLTPNTENQAEISSEPFLCSTGLWSGGQAPIFDFRIAREGDNVCNLPQRRRIVIAGIMFKRYCFLSSAEMEIPSEMGTRMTFDKAGTPTTLVFWTLGPCETAA